MSVIEYLRPASVTEAIELLGRHGPELLVMAGGTISMPLVNDGISAPRRVMSLRAAGMDTLERASGQIRIGATCPLQRLLELDEAPILVQAARETGSWAIRNMGTVGGNLFAPPPAGDVTVALLALDAVLLLAGPAAIREVPIDAFHTGFMTTDLQPDELLTEIRLPLPSRRDSVPQARPAAGQHAGGGDGRNPARARGRGGPGRAGGPRCRGAAPMPLGRGRSDARRRPP